MRPLRAVVAVLVALVPLTAAPAHAEPDGLRCGWSSLIDPQDDTGRSYLVDMDGGPILLDKDPAGQPVWGSLTCSLQVYPDVRHSDADLLRLTSPVTPGAAYLAPSLQRFETPDEFSTLMTCSQVDVVGRGTYYWDSPTQTWSTDPNAECAFPWEGEQNPPEDQIWYEVVDPAVCPPLATVAPPEGDVDQVWDCPPYGN